VTIEAKQICGESVGLFTLNFSLVAKRFMLIPDFRDRKATTLKNASEIKSVTPRTLNRATQPDGLGITKLDFEFRDPAGNGALFITCSRPTICNNRSRMVPELVTG
jgi:hypothetical protein